MKMNGSNVKDNKRGGSRVQYLMGFLYGERVRALRINTTTVERIHGTASNRLDSIDYNHIIVWPLLHNERYQDDLTH